MILDIIAVDHRCAQAVKDAKKKRQDTTADMNSKKKEIYIKQTYSDISNVYVSWLMNPLYS